jgi:hypothetical protein
LDFFPQKKRKQFLLPANSQYLAHFKNYLTTSEHDGTGRGCEKKAYAPIQNSVAQLSC